MLTVNEAFRKFKSRLELNQREQRNASARHTEVRDFLNTRFEVARSFLTGSYARHTKTKPLKDIDIFFELKEDERHYRSKSPSVVIGDFHDALVEKYGDDYEIPDDDSGRWIKTNPEIHAGKATAAHQAFSNEWKGLVRMAKYWNNNVRHGEKPVKPSFLIEVMALQCLYGGWQGRFDYEIQGFFSTLADRIFDEWPDPAGLGPAVSDGMDAIRKQRARELLTVASSDATIAIDHARRGRNGEALRAWRALFGPRFPLS